MSNYQFIRLNWSKERAMGDELAKLLNDMEKQLGAKFEPISISAVSDEVLVLVRAM